MNIVDSILSLLFRVDSTVMEIENQNVVLLEVILALHRESSEANVILESVHDILENKVTT
jgi:hypothetical protein